MSRAAYGTPEAPGASAAGAADAAREGVGDAGAPLVDCTGLVKRYGRTTALAGLQLRLERGAPIALVGPNGAGKTTLLSVLAGFVRPNAGRVRVLGERPGGGALAGRLAALPQDAALDPRLSIGHQLRVLAALQGIGARAARAEVERALDTVGLGDVERRRPSALSHGMRKRVALAQALIGEPALVLLDEPTAGIDPENARAIRELIVARAPRTTFLISSHNLDELERLCGSVVQLEGGRLVRHERLSAPAGAMARTATRPPQGAGGTHARAAASTGAAGHGATHGRAAGVDAAGVGAAPDAPTIAPELTLRLTDVPAEAFAAAARSLPAVRSLRRLSGEGDWLIVVDDETAGATALLELLAARGWAWRRLERGRSLEERLYGEGTGGVSAPPRAS